MCLWNNVRYTQSRPTQYDKREEILAGRFSQGHEIVRGERPRAILGIFTRLGLVFQVDRINEHQTFLDSVRENAMKHRYIESNAGTPTTLFPLRDLLYPMDLVHLNQ